MVSTRTTKSPRILISRAETGRPITPLVDALRGQGYDVTEHSSTTVGAHSAEGAIQEILNDFDMIFLAVRKRDEVEAGESVGPFQQILREAGVMQGMVGMKRVVLLVENTVDGLSANTGVPAVRYPPERPSRALNEVMGRISEAFPPDRRDLHEHVPIPRQARSAELRVPWLLVAVVLFAAAIPLIVALPSLLPDGGDDSEETAVVRGLTGVLAGAAAEAGATDGEDPAAPAAGQLPDSPELGTNASLPATCSLDLRKGTLLDDAIECDGAGGLDVVDRIGPWHNDLAAVILGDGVVGELIFEPGSGLSGEDRVVLLAGGVINLDPEAARFGVERLTFRFSAEGQHVHLVQSLADGGDSATLNFSLDE